MSSVRTSRTCLLLATISSGLILASGALADPPALEAVIIADGGAHPPGFDTSYWNLGSTPFTAPVIDESGKVTFTGVIFGDGITPANNRVSWYGEPSNWTVLARSAGAALPDLAGLTFASLNTGTPVNTPNGQVSVSGTLAGSGVTTSNDTVAWMGPVGSQLLAAREGNAAPGTSGALLGGTLVLPAGTRANNAGQMLLACTLTGGDTVTANNSCMYLTTTTGPKPSGMTKVWRKGDPMPGAPALPDPSGPFISHNLSGMQLNGSGDVLMTGSVIAGTAGGVTTSNDSLLFVVHNGVARVIARESDPIPGLTNAIYKVTASFTPATRAINNNGKILFNIQADNTNGGTDITLANDSIWLVDDNGTVSIAVREGDPLGPGNFSVANLQNISLNNNNRMAFNATSSTGTANLGCLFEGPIGGPYTTVVAQGDLVPGYTDVAISYAINNNMAYNDANQIVFFSNLTGAGVTTGVNDRAIFSWDAVNGIQMLARTGVTEIPGMLPLISLNLQGGTNLQNGECGAANFTNNGWLCFSVQDVKGFQAIMRTHLTPGVACPGDIDHSHVVDVNDLLAVVSTWGACVDPQNCPADTNHDGVVNVNDLLAVISTWGNCP